MVIRQVYKKDKKKLIDQAKAESNIGDYNEFQSNEKIDQLTKDFDSIYSAQEKNPQINLMEKILNQRVYQNFSLTRKKNLKKIKNKIIL